MVEMTEWRIENAGLIWLNDLDILHWIMLDIPSDEFKAHLFGGGGDYGISDTHGMVLAKFTQVFSGLVSDCQIDVNEGKDIEKGSAGISIRLMTHLPLAAQLIHIIRAAFDVSALRP